jgi:hypothetical protein
VTRLDEYSKEEWMGVCRFLKPGLTLAEYEQMWAGFVAYMSKRTLN